MLSFKDYINKSVAKFQDTLNPKLWDGNVLKKEIQEKLLIVAKKFLETLDLSQIVVSDIVITGSNANFNWTNHSDLDLHILLKEKEMADCRTCSAEVEDCIQAKKILWNDRHDITFKGIPLEIYATTSSEKLVKGSGTYSLQSETWITEPKKVELTIDAESVQAKAETIGTEIDQLIDSKTDDEEDIKEVQNKIHQMRQSGLDKNGEFSVENLAFKVLRTSGYIDKINDYFKNLENRDLSI